MSGGATSSSILFNLIGWSQGRSRTTLLDLNTATKQSTILYELADQPADVEVHPLAATSVGIVAYLDCRMCGAPNTTPKDVVLIKDKKVIKIDTVPYSTIINSAQKTSY